MSIIAGNIHQLRQTTNLTQKELAKALYVSIAHYIARIALILNYGRQTILMNFQ